MPKHGTNDIPNYPTFMDRARGMTGGLEPAMPDSEFGQEGPIVELFIAKMLRQYLKERTLDEQTGYSEQERGNMLEGFQQHLPTPFGYPAEFGSRFFDPEAGLDTGVEAEEMGFNKDKRIGEQYRPVKPWDMREF